MSPRTPVRAKGLADGLAAFAHVSPATDSAEDVTPRAKSPAPSSASRKRKRSFTLAEAPAGWRATWDLILELRADRTAVVDTMGCESAAASCADEGERAFHSLVSLMLSSQTKDTTNAMVMKRLREHGLSVASVSAMSEDTLRDLIWGAGFGNNKAKYIKAATQIIVEQHGGVPPATMDGLLALPGVGPKMALIQLNVVHGLCVGISVDTHVHRIANQLRWTGDEGTSMPEKTREALESWMPQDQWPCVNVVLVGLGQEVQTEKAKLLRKCLACSDPPRALELLATLGVNVERERAKAQL
ncbi:hypothetical protein KFE25_007599 [Diacronema lutheri]|uniref:HhH-GPD domain-containing protein n=1 Tax=Diacronema lutheri TaxID=2081491 RepID=A0A8J5XU92_DIALT|nr:hypothetical protein KFE25_007599 [Diacronema lutheri]